MQKNLRYFAYLSVLIALTCAVWQYGPSFYRIYGDRELLSQYLSAAGIWAPAIFVLLTAAQVIVAPIPAVVLALAGGYVFGLLPGFLLSSIGILLGSTLAFALAKRFGLPLVIRLIGRSNYTRLEPLVAGKGILAVAVIFLLPFMPDDALCFLAAVTPMRARIFVLLVVFCRAPGLLVSSLVGSGVLIIPWFGYALIGVISLLVFYLAWRHSSRLESWAIRLARPVAER